MLGIRRKENMYQMVFHGRDFALLKQLPGMLRSVLEEMDADSPAVQRLFPAASFDAEVNREFQELAAQGIRDRKEECLVAFEQSLADARVEVEVRLVFLKVTAEQFEMWIGFLNDMKLLIATEIGIEDDEWDATEAYEQTGDERIVLFDYVGSMQFSLLQMHMSEGEEVRWLVEDEDDGEDDEEE